jgi:hypothetical protein
VFYLGLLKLIDRFAKIFHLEEHAFKGIHADIKLFLDADFKTA